jgi:hypothetical protein
MSTVSEERIRTIVVDVLKSYGIKMKKKDTRKIYTPVAKKMIAEYTSDKYFEIFRMHDVDGTPINDLGWKKKLDKGGATVCFKKVSDVDEIYQVGVYVCSPIDSFDKLNARIEAVRRVRKTPYTINRDWFGDSATLRTIARALVVKFITDHNMYDDKRQELLHKCIIVDGVDENTIANYVKILDEHGEGTIHPK